MSKLFRLERWEERDRVHVAVLHKDTEETLYEFWDEAVHEAIQDGFLRPTDLFESMMELMVERGFPRASAEVPVWKIYLERAKYGKFYHWVAEHGTSYGIAFAEICDDDDVTFLELPSWSTRSAAQTYLDHLARTSLWKEVTAVSFSPVIIRDLIREGIIR